MSKITSKYNSSSKSPSGLGRGLDGILSQSEVMPAEELHGLGQLLGVESGHTSPKIKEYVADAALSAIAGYFQAEAVVMASRSITGSGTTFAAKLPANWSANSALGFEMYGQLWEMLTNGLLVHKNKSTDDLNLDPVMKELNLENQYVWFATLCLSDSVVSVCVVRRDRFSQKEINRLVSLFRSVGSALDTGFAASVPEDVSLGVTLRPSRQGKTAEVRIECQGETHQVGVEAKDSKWAVAYAAASLCSMESDVTYVGDARVDGSTVTIVVLLDYALGPLLGISVNQGSEKPCVSDPASAVFSAAASVDASPFAVT